MLSHALSRLCYRLCSVRSYSEHNVPAPKRDKTKDDKVKILQVTNVLSPLHGGSADVAYRLSKELAKRGHEVTIYTSDHKLGRKHISSMPAVRVYAARTWLSSANLFVAPGIIKKAKEETRHFDIIHLHGYRTFQNIVVAHYARQYHIPCVLQAHGSLTTFFHQGWLKRTFDVLWGYRILQDTAKVIAVAKAEVEHYKSMRMDEDKIEIIPNGIDLAEFDNLPQKGGFRRKYGLDDKQRIILYLGRIHQIKGLDLLANAYADITQSLPDTKLVIVGPDTGYLSSLKQLVADLEISHQVLFTGPLYGQEKLQAYVDADVYALPSSYEIFGITLLEALACGTPLVITDRCGLADIISGQAGLVVPYDKDQLRDALLHMLSDDQMRLRFGERGKLLVGEQFNWENIAEQFEHVYQTCCRQ